MQAANPDQKELNYSLKDILDFVDKLNTCVLMEYKNEDKDKLGYRPHCKDWIKALLLSKFIPMN